MTDFTATFEYLPGQGAAIIALFDNNGEWSGASRIEFKSRREVDLFEYGYDVASSSASGKGGRLTRYTRV